MHDPSEQTVVSKNAGIKNNQQIKPNTVLLYIASIVYLLIPVLSTESFVVWSIGFIGIYKTAKLYKNNEEKKELKSLKYFIFLISAAVMFNVLVHYATKILMKKFA